MNNSIEKIKENLQEDLMIRPPLVKYSLKHFTDMLQLINALDGESSQKIAQETAAGYYERNSQSPLTAFTVYFLNIILGNNPEQNIDKLFHLFAAIKKPGITVFFAKEILKYHESLTVLNILAAHYHSENQTDDLLYVQMKILSKEPANYELPQKIAAALRKQEDEAEALRYMKMAFFRAFDGGHTADVLQIWKSLLKYNDTDYAFVLEYARKITARMIREKAHAFYLELFTHYNRNYAAHTDICLELIKYLFEQTPDDQFLKEDILSLYRVKYKDHSLLNDFLTISGLTKIKKNIPSQIAVFEKHILFDKGTYVRHNSFGYGKITDIQKAAASGGDASLTRLFIDFTGKKNHMMTLRIALSSLEICASDNVICLSHFSPEMVKDQINTDLQKFADSFLDSFGKPVGINDIKSLIVPALLTDEEWKPVAKKLLDIYTKGDAYECKNKMYTKISSGGSYKDDLRRQFSRTTDPVQKLKIIDMYLMNYHTSDEAIRSMTRELFTQREKAKEQYPSILIGLMIIKKQHPDAVEADLEKEFSTFSENADLPHTYDALHNHQARIFFLDAIGHCGTEKMQKIYFSNHALGKNHIIEILKKEKQHSAIQEIWHRLHTQYREFPEHYVHFAAQFFFDEQNCLSLDKNTVYLDLLNVLDLLYKDIAIDSVQGSRKRAYTTLMGCLFGDDGLLVYLEQDEAAVRRKDFFRQLNAMLFLENYLKVKIKELMSRLT